MMTEELSVQHRFERELQPIVDVAFRYAFRLTGNRDEAMDLVQDASLLAFKYFASYSPETNFRAWFLRILTNRFFRNRERASKLATESLDAAPDLYLYDRFKADGIPVDREESVASVFEKINEEAVQAALSKLPEEYRVVATLHLVSEMPYEEIAAVLEIPVGTVRSRLHRARKQLQVHLWELAQAYGITPKETQ